MLSGKLKAASAAALVLVALLAFSASAAAVRVLVVEPVAKELLSPQVLDLGLVGPGQKIEIAASRGSGELSKIKGLEGREAYWDKLIILKDSLPPEWSGVDSLLYEEPLKAFVLVAKDAPDGEYEFEAKVYDEYEGAPPLVFKAKVKVSRDVFEATIAPTTVRAGVGQPAVYYFTLKNKGSASDVFELSVEKGLPGEWTFTRRVFVRHNSEARANYEIASGERGEFLVSFHVKSLSSEHIAATQNALLIAETSLLQDARAAAHGMLLFPSIEQIIYAFLGFVANLLAL